PVFLAEHPLETPDALAEVAIIRDVNWRSDWDHWMQAAGTSGSVLSRYLDFSTYTQAIDAALRGRGVVMAHDARIAEHLADGRLVAPFDVRVGASSRYYAVTRKGVGQDSAVRAFLDWLFAEARAMSRR